MLAIVLAGCGGSSGDERTQLLNKLSAQLNHSSAYSPDLAACVKQKAGALPIDQLKSVANSDLASGPTNVRIALRLVVSCVQEGHGASALRAAINAGAAGVQVGSDLPPQYLQCVAQGLEGISNAQLGGLVNELAVNPTKGREDARQIGVKYGLVCLGEPTVLRAMRAKLIAPIKAGFRSRHYSAAFTRCVLGKAQRISATQVRQLATAVLHGNSAQDEALGRRWAQECIASGARP